MSERKPLPPSGVSEEELLSWLRSCFSTEQDPLVTLHKRMKTFRTSSRNQWKYEEEEDGLS
jgi:hypothetical protein